MTSAPFDVALTAPGEDDVLRVIETTSDTSLLRRIAIGPWTVATRMAAEAKLA